MTALELLEKEKNIKKEDLLEALKAPLVTAYKKYYGAGENVFVVIDDDGKITVHEKRTVVEEAEDYDYEISLDEAQFWTLKQRRRISEELRLRTQSR